MREHKIILNRQEETLFTFSEKMQIDFIWSSDVDFDLCLFWKTKDGKEGGVFPEAYRSCGLGNLNEFPFIRLCRDMMSRADGKNEERIIVKSMDAMSELHIVIINFIASIEDIPYSFNKDSGVVEIITDTGCWVEIPVNSTQQGFVYRVGIIENTEAAKKIIHRCNVLFFEEALSQIPGFEWICG
jgi:uncharacterized protein involved in tellurium resistance